MTSAVQQKTTTVPPDGTGADLKGVLCNGAAIYRRFCVRLFSLPVTGAKTLNIIGKVNMNGVKISAARH